VTCARLSEKDRRRNKFNPSDLTSFSPLSTSERVAEEERQQQQQQLSSHNNITNNSNNGMPIQRQTALTSSSYLTIQPSPVFAHQPATNNIISNPSFPRISRENEPAHMELAPLPPPPHAVLSMMTTTSSSLSYPVLPSSNTNTQQFIQNNNLTNSLFRSSREELLARTQPLPPPTSSSSRPTSFSSGTTTSSTHSNTSHTAIANHINSRSARRTEQLQPERPAVTFTFDQFLSPQKVQNSFLLFFQSIFTGFFFVCRSNQEKVEKKEKKEPCHRLSIPWMFPSLPP
jgi:hypothetical protein